MLDNPAGLLWHRVVFPEEFETDYEERILAEARSIAQRRLSGRLHVRDPRAARELLMLRLLGNPEELFACVFLDSRHRVIACEILFRGSIDGCAVHPRVIARYALLHNAAAVIVAHNHPSGVCEPSESDRRITHQIRETLSLFDVRL
ncbi:DNA repair protein RadC [Tahibacter aquaticus]|uniref:DNA repair protein RadC n=1 Tax=Tahibacter aquaticus TaxID=520092 RepID=A0A4R6YMP3_9GAMM|nr:JAB domain-containing protein [Tahibacter aquaticus]TDR38673.1 DNA repair protein RadC [Tahibacter aquaticus]